jgi:hypothetical protein
MEIQLNLLKMATIIKIFYPIQLTVLQLLLFIITGNAQTISGTVNSTASGVTAQSIVANTITVTSATGFAVNDKIIVIQMNGATMDATTAATFGDVTDYNNAGKYEILNVCDVTGNVLKFDKAMANTYDLSAKVQAIKIEKYTNVTVNGTLTAPAWNGTTGGVLAIEVTGTLTLTANINMDGKGFRGGAIINANGNCTNLASNSTATFYNISLLTTAVFPYSSGAKKGEGIADYISTKEGGKGAQTNGGGGGGNHNAGGGGGANLVAGGNGGQNTNVSGCKGITPGLGGKAISSSGNRVYMGGGGGAGHENNNLGTAGGAGGGIIYIKAAVIEGGGNGISAKGANAANGASDGTGGGGSGGTLLLTIPTYNSTITTSVAGGNGGNVDNEAFSRCFGPGGGGAGGIIYFSNGSLPGGITTVVTGGTKGARTNSAQAGCVGIAVGEADGAAGSTSFSFAKIESSTDFSCLVLPVVISQWHGISTAAGVVLDWQSLSEKNFFRFEIQRKGALKEEYTSIAIVAPKNDEQVQHNYTFTDLHPIYATNYYRLKMVDVDGSFQLTDVLPIKVENPNNFEWNLFPNPIQYEQIALTVQAKSTITTLQIQIMDYTGKRILIKEEKPKQNEFKAMLPTNLLTSGMYFIQIIVNGSTIQTQKIMVQ